MRGGPLGIGDGQHPIDDAEQYVVGGLNCLFASDRYVLVPDLLKHLRIGDQSSACSDVALEHALRVDLVGMRRADEVSRR